jgi:hypothetical protein
VKFDGSHYVLYSDTFSYSIGVAATVLNEWHHIAITRSGSQLRVYFDGVEKFGTGYALNLINRDFLSVGEDVPAYGAANGPALISNIRIVRSNLYPTNFTPSAIVPARLPGTTFLLQDYMPQFSGYSAGRNTLVIGDGISTFGFYEMALNGTADHSNTSNQTSSEMPPVLGTTGPGGGNIFYYDPAGFACGPTASNTGTPTGGKCHYLEAAPTTGDHAWSETSASWSANTNTALGTTNTGIGFGYSNTISIVNQSGAGTAGAASLANDYVGPNNSTDWYLPSKDELAQLYSQSALVSASTGYYWSSSEYSATLAWRQPFFGAGTPEQDVKSAYSWNLVARAIRAF